MENCMMLQLVKKRDIYGEIDSRYGILLITINMILNNLNNKEKLREIVKTYEEELEYPLDLDIIEDETERTILSIHDKLINLIFNYIKYLVELYVNDVFFIKLSMRKILEHLSKIIVKTRKRIEDYIKYCEILIPSLI